MGGGSVSFDRRRLSFDRPRDARGRPLARRMRCRALAQLPTIGDIARNFQHEAFPPLFPLIVRGYGLGSAMIVLIFGCLGSVLRTENRRRVITATLACLFGVQILLYNSVLLLAIGAAAFCILLLERRFKPIVCHSCNLRRRTNFSSAVHSGLPACTRLEHPRARLADFLLVMEALRNRAWEPWLQHSSSLVRNCGRLGRPIYFSALQKIASPEAGSGLSADSICRVRRKAR